MFGSLKSTDEDARFHRRNCSNSCRTFPHLLTKFQNRQIKTVHTKTRRLSRTRSALVSTAVSSRFHILIFFSFKRQIISIRSSMTLTKWAGLRAIT
ncbi:unnamed protein product [Oikopleura dioica]|uniref:Uncharacterized protein n=1 Tax=Oikopleura dioica TaxID=34765 RepID=E4XAP2_OIKDI|nr:unnamed protein product [Oikopleura dioica]